jgi:hypothetical protein
MRTAEETALLIALLLKRSEQRQGRLNIDTLRCLSRRKHIRGAFLRLLAEHLDDLGLILMEIDADGFGLIASSALSGAPVITAKNYLRDDMNKLRRGEIDFGDIRDELDRAIAADDEDGL